VATTNIDVTNRPFSFGATMQKFLELCNPFDNYCYIVNSANSTKGILNLRASYVTLYPGNCGAIAMTPKYGFKYHDMESDLVLVEKYADISGFNLIFLHYNRTRHNRLEALRKRHGFRKLFDIQSNRHHDTECIITYYIKKLDPSFKGY
jgi:hypothetical protein